MEIQRWTAVLDKYGDIDFRKDDRGVHVFYADHLAQLQKLREAVKDLLPIAEQAMPKLGHEGSCGPESGCDGICAEAASIATTIHKARAALGKD